MKKNWANAKQQIALKPKDEELSVIKSFGPRIKLPKGSKKSAQIPILLPWNRFNERVNLISNLQLKQKVSDKSPSWRQNEL